MLPRRTRASTIAPTHRGWLLALLLPFAAACNGIVGNDSVSLWSGDAATDGTSPAPDGATDSAPDAPADAGPTSCPAPLTDAGAPTACPALEAGACGPQNINPPVPWVPPTQPNNQCTTAQFAAVFTACFATQATAATCSAWMNASKNGTCSDCIFSDLGALSYGPYLVYPGAYGEFNNAGCVVLLDPCQEPCARIFESYVNCQYNSCFVSCMTPDVLSSCEPQADTCECAPQANATLACQNSITAAHSPAAACLTTNQEAIQKLLPVFCGKPSADAGGG